MTLSVLPHALRASEIDDETLSPVGSQSFRQAMRQLASGVCIVAHGAGAARAGMTATAVASLSLEPPSLVVCVNQSASCCSGLALGVAFTVNVLGAHQEQFADRFAGRAGLEGAARFHEGRWIESPLGAPALADSLAVFECFVEDLVVKHTHALVIGRVASVASRRQGGALVCWRGAYDQLGWNADELSRAVGQTPPTPQQPPARRNAT